MPLDDTTPRLSARLATLAPRELRAAMARRAEAHEHAAPTWQITRDAYEGTGGFACSVRSACTTGLADGDVEGGQYAPRRTYLTRFSREAPGHFTARADRSAYTNHIAPIVDTYHGHLARRRPRRDSTSALVSEWWQDVDGHGHEMAEWIAPVAKAAQLFGWRAVLVDRPTEVDPSRPQTVVRDLEPEELRDWQMAPDGRLAWARLGSSWCERDPVDGTDRVVEVYTTWTREEWAQVHLTRPVAASDDKWTVEHVTGDVHSLGRVPVVILRWQRSVQPRALYGVSQIAPVLPLALALFNTESEYADHLANQNFAFLAIQSDSPEALANLKLGTNDAMTYPSACAAPQYVAPPADVAVQYALRAEGLVRAIYAAARLERPSAEASGGDAASGVAKAYDFAATDAALQSFARALAEFEYELVDLVARWAGDDRGDAVLATKIEYPQRFDARGIADDLNALFAVLDEKVRPLMPPTAVRLAVTGIVNAVFPEATPTDVETYTAEIEGMGRTAEAAASVADAIGALPAADAADPLNTATP